MDYHQEVELEGLGIKFTSYNAGRKVVSLLNRELIYSSSSSLILILLLPTTTPKIDVLGAAMFLIEIAGIRILYTGDYSREEDRHLMAAERPPAHIVPEVLICESTYGTQTHQPRLEREAMVRTSLTEIFPNSLFRLFYL